MREVGSVKRHCVESQAILEAYMIFGGVPYYWSLLQKGTSITAEIDRLIFSPNGELHDEFEMLYASLFKKPEPYVRVIELLAEEKDGHDSKRLVDGRQIRRQRGIL